LDRTVIVGELVSFPARTFVRTDTLKNLVVLAIAAVMTLVSGQTEAGSPKIITNVTLLSPERSAPLPDAWVRIDEGIITAVGSGSIDTSGLEVIDANGSYIIPGLIDSHVHLYHATGLKRRYTDDFDRLYTDFMDQQPRSFLFFGFTSVIELNSKRSANARFEAAPVHPRLFHCGQAVILSDGFMALELEGTPIDEVYPGYLIDHHAGGAVPEAADPALHTPKAVVANVRKQGGRCVKLYYEEALWWPGGAPDFRLPSAAIVRDVVAAAHAQGLPVVLHATTPNGHRFALETDVDVLGHGMWEWPGQGFATPDPSPEYLQVARAVAQSDVGLQPTFSTILNTASLFEPDLLDDPTWMDVVPAAYLDYLRNDAQQQRDAFLTMFGPQFAKDASVEAVPSAMQAFTLRYERLIGAMAADDASLLFGTDTAVGGFGWASPPGLAGYREIQAWRRAGVSLKSLFASLTIGNARAFGLDREVGTIEAGKHADLLILNSNPLEDVMAYDTIVQVILGGEVIARDSLSARNQVR
jgi:imidazolonepropionase-like amidohydrolase